MKFNRMVVIIGVCSLLCCSKQDNNLSGTWIGAYYFVPQDSTFRSKFPLNWLVEVSDDELNVTTLKLDGVHPQINQRRSGIDEKAIKSLLISMKVSTPLRLSPRTMTA